MAISQAAVEARARSLKLLLFDVDGVLTDGSVMIHADGGESKGFFIRDGLGLIWAQKAGLQLVEVPIDWHHQQESKVRPFPDTFRMLADAALVRWRYQTGRYRLGPIREAKAGPGSKGPLSGR